MARFGEKPIKKPGVKSRASKKKTAEQAKKQDERAQRRFAVVQFALRWLKANGDESLLEAYRAAKKAADEGKLKWPPPARATFYLWVERARLDDRGAAISTFKDKPRSGRPPKEWDEQVRDQADRLIRAGVFSEGPLYDDLKQFAELR